MTDVKRKNAEDKKQEEYKKILNELLKEEGNKACADCGAVAPRWASATLGIFLCIKCSGIHRSMGTHISFVRSVTLDDWKEQEIQKMKETGNTKSNLYWEARVPPGYPRAKPGDNIGLERWIRDKYEAKRFVKKSISEPTSIQHTPVRSTTPNPPIRPQTPTTPPVAFEDPFSFPSLSTSTGNNGVTAVAPTVVKPVPRHIPPQQSNNLFQIHPQPDPEFGEFVSPSAPTTSNTSLLNQLNQDPKSNIMSMFNLQPIQYNYPLHYQHTQQPMLYNNMAINNNVIMNIGGSVGYPQQYYASSTPTAQYLFN